MQGHAGRVGHRTDGRRIQPPLPQKTHQDLAPLACLQILTGRRRVVLLENYGRENQGFLLSEFSWVQPRSQQRRRFSKRMPKAVGEMAVARKPSVERYVGEGLG